MALSITGSRQSGSGKFVENKTKIIAYIIDETPHYRKSDKLSILELKIPPLIVVFLIAAGMMVINVLWLPGIISYPYNIIIAIILALAGTGFIIVAVLALRRAKTTPNPIRPENATVLVTSGIYARTRNPIYLGLALWLVALAVYLINPLTYPGPLFFILYMNRFQIRPEERALEKLFGKEFEIYKSRVGRWI